MLPMSRCLFWISFLALYLSLCGVCTWASESTIGQEEDEKEEQKCTRERGVCPEDKNENAPVGSIDNHAGDATRKEKKTSTAAQKKLECGMYMAESSIPNSGWGMYTTIDREKGSPILPLDLVIQVPDLKRFMKKRQPSLPKWLLDQYYWNSETTGAYHDARNVASIVPGLGMLANSHTGLVNARERGPHYRMQLSKGQVEAGAFTEYKDQTFVASREIPAGMELFVQYGDEWFEGRAYAFGDAIPLSGDYQNANDIISSVADFCNHTFATDFCRDFWQLIRHDLKNATSPRLLSALPETLDGVKEALDKGSALYLTPNVIRSIEWLQQHGQCLDHLEPKESTIEHAGSGAFATRDLPKGTIVAPAPVVHMHRGHMDVFILDENDEEQVHWKGHQLLLNYLYGHPSTSLVFFPYSPVINFINHSPNPNVELRWSSGTMAHPEWMNLTTDQVVAENSHTGLMMEIVALKDIHEGEEVVLDYGRDWEAAWEKHVKTWQKPLNGDTHKPLEAIGKQKRLPTQDDDDDIPPLPGNAMTLCWVDWDHVEEDEDTGDYIWQTSTPTHRLDEAFSCKLLSRKTVKGQLRYSARVEMDEGVREIKNMHRRAIAIVDKPYTPNQMLRQSFRHEIHLPENMIPPSWKDVEAVESETCQLYMAESSIPNSGLGMFTGKSIKEHGDISFPEITIQGLDMEYHHALRRWSVGIRNDDDNTEPDCLLDHYYWNPNYAAAEDEAEDVQSIIPGIGMLANSHTGHFNAGSRRPLRDNTGLQPQSDPGAGASTSYHGVRFVAYNGDIPSGSEIFVEYGDNWFKDSEERLGLIPLSGDYAQADKLLLQFWDVIGGDVEANKSKDLWDLFLQDACVSSSSRVCLALPRDLEDVEDILDTGTGTYSVRDSIRSTDWLELNGRCLDNIKPGVSKIPQAGRGAFATRGIKKGLIIATAPLVQLNRHQMEMLKDTDRENDEAEIIPIGSQLLRNYCFGHQNSSLLLYPYSPAVNYINHDHHNYNAELQWSTLAHHRSDWLNQSVDELMRMPHTGLIIEFVATRNILPGEEILINYGNRWEEAWNDYVKSWKPDDLYRDYSPAWKLNDYTMPVRTNKEQGSNPYPRHVRMACYVGPLDADQPGKLVNGQLEYEWTFVKTLYYTTNNAFPCEILKRTGEYVDTADSIRPVAERYTVRVWRVEGFAWTVTHVPRRAIEFFDAKEMSDLHLRNAFRHEMDLPDHMLPLAWINVD